MPITHPPRPAFLLRRSLEWLGAPRPVKTLALGGTDLDDLIRNEKVLDAWWKELENLIVALLLAGYECPELIVARPGTPQGYLRLPCWIGLLEDFDPQEPLVVLEPGSWTAASGVEPGDLPATATAVTLLRAEVRRTIDTPVRRAEGRPPRFPPIPLEGLVSGFHPGPPGNPDPFADPLDGWIAFAHLPTTAGEPGALKMARNMGAIADDARDAVADALVDAWLEAKASAPDQPPDVGLLRLLDPDAWDVPLDRACWVWPFDDLAREIWAALDDGNGAALRELLKAKIDADSASVRALGNDTSVKVGDAIDALRDRGKRLGITDESLELALAHLRSRHWVLALCSLHDAGLLRILPFPVDFEPAIPYIDLTGWYETTYAEINIPVNAAMQLNHAGDRLSGWFQDADLNRWDLDLRLVSFDPEGTETLAYAGSFTNADRTVDGTITEIPRADPDEVNVLVSFTRNYVLTRRHRHARIAPPVVAAALGSEDPEALAAQLLPLHSHAEKVVDEAITMLVSSVEDMEATIDSATWDSTVDVLERDLRGVLETEGVLRFTSEWDGSTPVNRVVETGMLQRFRAEAQRRLRSTKISSGEGGDGLTKFRNILFVLTEPDALPSVAQIQALVGVTPQGHLYEYLMLELGPEVDVNIIAGGSAGVALTPMSITHKPECAENGVAGHGWADLYLGAMGMVSGGVAAEARGRVTVFTVSTDNQLSTLLDWGPDDFVPTLFVVGETAGEGSFHLLSFFGLKGGPGVAGGPELEAYTFFGLRGMATGSGDGWFVSLGAGAAVTAPVLGPFGFGWSILGVNVGVIFARWGLAQPNPPPPPPVPDPGVFPLNMTVEQLTPFAFDEDELPLQAQDELAGIVARHRQLLESPHAKLEIEGDASPEGTDPYNDRLSWRRALAVYTHVMRLLSAPASPSSSPASNYDATNALAVRDSNVTLVGHGESRTKYPTAEPRVPEDWRRAKLVINGQVMVFL